MKTVFPIKEYPVEGRKIPFVESPLLEGIEGLRHGFSTRLGGVSEQHLSALNLGFSLGDEKERVLENYRLLAGALGVSAEDFVLSKQSHSVHVLQVGKKDRGKGIFSERDYQDVDGMITEEEDVVLSVFSADCVPILLYDRVHRAIGACHSGWRGTRGKILKNVISAMETAFSSRPEDLLLAIGPSICKNCYEVSEDVGEAFLEAFPFDERSDPKRREALKAAIQRSSEEKFHIDLWELNRQIALDASVPSENISISGYCTMERPDLFFSHRYSKGKRGVQGAFIGLKPVSREV